MWAKITQRLLTISLSKVPNDRATATDLLTCLELLPPQKKEEPYNWLHRMKAMGLLRDGWWCLYMNLIR